MHHSERAFKSLQASKYFYLLKLPDTHGVDSTQHLQHVLGAAYALDNNSVNSTLHLQHVSGAAFAPATLPQTLCKVGYPNSQLLVHKPNVNRVISV